MLLVCVPLAAAKGPPRYLNKQYSDAVHGLRDCLDVLSAKDRRIVVLRSGIGPGDPAGPQQVASAVKIPVASVATAQWGPIREMRAAQKAGQCGTAKTTATASKPAATKPAATKAAFATASEPTDTGGWSSPKVLILLGIAGLCLIGVLRELLGAVRA
jgi:hypothetical protein